MLTRPANEAERIAKLEEAARAVLDEADRMAMTMRKRKIFNNLRSALKEPQP